MSPCHPPANRKILVPRHNSQRLGPLLSSKIAAAARVRKLRVDVKQSVYFASDPAGELAKAVESASEWNSMLLTARAERGPQWDVGTQQFLVDEGSDLFYNPAPLRGEEPSEAHVAKQEPARGQPMPQHGGYPLPPGVGFPQAHHMPMPMSMSPQMHRAPPQPVYGNPAGANPFSPMSPYGPGGGFGMGNMGNMSNMGGMPGMPGMNMGNMGNMSGQFYGANPGADMMSPMQGRRMMTRGMGGDDGAWSR